MILLTVLGAALAASLQSATGMGFALVLTPLLVLAMPPAAAVLTVTLLGLELNLLVLRGERRAPAIAWPEVGPLLVMALPGAAAGVLVLHALPRAALQVALGSLVLGLVALQALARRPAPRLRPSPLARAAVGLTTGVLTTASGFSGPPLALWLSHRGLAPAQLRDSLSASFLVLGAIGAVALIPLIPGSHLSPAALPAGVAAVLLGHAAGSRIFRRLPRSWFRPLLLGIVAVTGATSLIAGLAA